jgi:cytochrome c peroxidase
MKRVLRIIVISIAAIAAAAAFWQWLPKAPPAWTDAEILVLQSLSLSALPELPPDPSNAVADNPEAAAFGRVLFHDARLSADGSTACVTCHLPALRFTDGLQKGQAIGTSKRNTPSIVGTAYSPWLYWDGRRDSQWAQALSPLEDPNEHGSSREQIVALILTDEAYRSMYDSLFGTDVADVNRVFANIGKSIAAFERTLMPSRARFDEYVAAVVAGDVEQQSIFSEDEVWGLRLFSGEANCLQCHNGPLLTNNEFHNTGVISFSGEVPDKGRLDGVLLAFADEFNCRGQYSDDALQRCDELEFARTGIELLGTVRTPSLRNLGGTAPFMHKGQLATLQDVLEHYNEAPDAMVGHNEAKPLGLSSRELRQLEAFLHTLDAPIR